MPFRTPEFEPDIVTGAGDMVYYKNNATQNYGDAVEGAKTACLRRCAKELGIGLQAWKKDFCEGWKQRKRQGARPQPAPAPAPPKPSAEDEKRIVAKTRERMIAVLTEAKLEDAAKAFAEHSGWILPTETLDDIPDKHVPRTKQAMDDLRAAVGRFVDSGEVPQPPDDDQVPGAEVPPSEDEPWRSFPVPFGKHAGVMLGKLDKKVLWGFWNNYAVETEFNGKPKKPETIAKDQAFRAMLDDAGRHYAFTKKD